MRRSRSRMCRPLAWWCSRPSGRCRDKGQAETPSFSGLVVIGDSLSDSGNAGHFSDGPVRVEHVAARLAVRLRPSRLGFGVASIGLGEQACDEGADGRLAPAAGVVDELEEAELGWQVFLRDAARCGRSQSAAATRNRRPFGGFSFAGVPRPGAPLSRRLRPEHLFSQRRPGCPCARPRHRPRRSRSRRPGSRPGFWR